AGLRKLLEEIRRNQSSLEKLLMKETKSVLWSLCFKLKLRTGARVKRELVNQILQWRSTSEPEDVPVIPALSYDRDPVGWEDTTAQPAPSSMDEFRVSEPVCLASFFQPIIDYPKIPAVKSPFPIDVLVIQSFISFKSLIRKQRSEHGADDEAPQLQYNELKRTFEADEPSKSGFMKFALVHLHHLCREYKIPPFDSDDSDIISFKKIEM
ncbi:hypothetical protein F5876DRAFT_71397, partial [Lentinula aff. lateritia]